MGTTAATNIRKKIIGSNALRIVAESDIPVITVKIGCETKNFNNLILPLDLAKETREEFHLLLDLQNFRFNYKSCFLCLNLR